MAGRSRYTIRYTDEQVNAIMRAVLIDGHKVAQAIRMAETGQLDTPAFKLDRRYAYQLVKKRRDAFEMANPEAMAHSTEAELRRIHALNLAKARKLDGDSDPTEIAKIAKATAETLRAIKTSETKPPARAKAPMNTPEPERNTAPKTTAPDVLAGLISKAAPKSGSLDHAPKQPAPSSPASSP